MFQSVLRDGYKIVHQNPYNLDKNITENEFEKIYSNSHFRNNNYENVAIVKIGEIKSISFLNEILKKLK